MTSSRRIFFYLATVSTFTRVDISLVVLGHFVLEPNSSK